MTNVIATMTSERFKWCKYAKIRQFVLDVDGARHPYTIEVDVSRFESHLENQLDWFCDVKNDVVTKKEGAKYVFSHYATHTTVQKDLIRAAILKCWAESNI